MNVSRRVYLATFAAYLTADFVAPLAGPLGRGVHSSIDPGTLIVPFCAAFAVAFPVWGRVADRRRAGEALAASLFALAAFGVLLTLAPSVGVAVVARVGEGAAAAGVPPTAQAPLAGRAGNASAGRAVSGMMVTVALATLGGPAIAAGLADVIGWRPTAALLGVLPALAAGVLCAPLCSWQTEPARARLRPTRELVAGWLCATFVLAAYWTLVTRWSVLADGAGIGAAGAAVLLPLAGAVGVPLVLVAGRAADRRGPRVPMVATMIAGTVSLALAAAASSPVVFLICAGAAVALYWGYLPVVSAQVQRSAPADARASAAGILYSAMWLGAALGGLAAVAAPDSHQILAGAAISWALAGIVAWRGFLPHPVEREA
jgi:predicted MFS family arabinose efflux permease